MAALSASLDVVLYLLILWCTQKLKYLDVSLNKLQSARLGSRPQLPALVGLSLAHNDIAALKVDDFSFLNRSSFLRLLNLSSIPLKKASFSLPQSVALLVPQRDHLCAPCSWSPAA